MNGLPDSTLTSVGIILLKVSFPIRKATCPLMLNSKSLLKVAPVWGEDKFRRLLLADQLLKSMHDLLVRGNGESRCYRPVQLALYPGSSTSQQTAMGELFKFFVPVSSSSKDRIILLTV